MASLVNAVITPVVKWPWRLINLPVHFVLVITGVKKRRHYKLPVAGLEQSRAQGILFTLRRAATNAEEEGIAHDWLIGWQLATVASVRLLHELDEVQANLQFWTRRVKGGSHFWFMLLQQGPRGFYRRLKQLLTIRHGDIAEAVPFLSEAEMVEKRVLVFRLLRTALCEALAHVQHAGMLLYLKEASRPNSTGSPIGSDAGVVSLSSEAEEGLFERASRAVHEAMDEIVMAFEHLQTSAHAALSVPETQSLAHMSENAGREASLLSQTVAKVLRLPNLRAILSRQQLAGAEAEGTAGAGGAAAGSAAGERGVAGSSKEISQGGGGSRTGGKGAASGGTFRSSKSLHEAQERVREVLGLAGAEGVQNAGSWAVLLPPPAAAASAFVAELAARQAARRLRRRRVVELPKWILMPSELQQHWIRYTLVSAGVGYVSFFLYRHSRLSGSPDLENWALQGVEAVRGALRENVVKPLAQVKDELFNTFRRRPTIVSMEEFIQDKDSLQRMLDDFKTDLVRRKGPGALPTLPAPPPAGGSSNGSASGGSVAAQGTGSGVTEAAVPGSGEVVPLNPPAELEGMQLVMRCYEQELKKPVRNLINGELARSLLIQVQKMKLDTESAMLELDQILRANELSISLVAAVPSFLFAGATLYYIGSLLTPTPPDPRTEAVPCRLGMVEVSRALEKLCREKEEGQEGPCENEGWFYYCLANEYEEAQQLFRRHTTLLSGGSSRSEWPALQADLIDLATPASVKQRMRSAKRMMRAYGVFHQF